MKRVRVLLITCIVLNIFTPSFAKEIPFTQEERDRLIRLEEGQKSLQRQIDGTRDSLQREIDKTRDSLQRQIADLKTFMLWGFGILFGGMGILIGFVIWDRRTALAPAIRKNKELEEREERALKELAAKDPKVAEVLKHVWLL